MSRKRRRFKYNSQRYKEWRNSVYLRDGFSCKMCGLKNTVINAHHIKRKADNPGLVYKKDNGITLCEECHRVVTGSEKLFAPLFEAIIKHDLTAEYVLKFFSLLYSKYYHIAALLQSYQKWDKIPFALIKQIKNFEIINKHGRKRANSR